MTHRIFLRAALTLAIALGLTLAARAHSQTLSAKPADAGAAAVHRPESALIP